MSGEFADSNIVIYALGDGPKAAPARQLLYSKVIISVQVLNEVLNVLRRKQRLGWPDIHERLALLREAMPIVPLTFEVHRQGVWLAERYGLSTYDAMIAAAALHAGCSVLWSEDLQDGLVLEGQIMVRNPFLNR
jgi:predicted nucleic acid-binding protein